MVYKNPYMPLIVPTLPDIREEDLPTLVGKYMVDDIDDPANTVVMPVEMHTGLVFFKSQLPKTIVVLPMDTYVELDMLPNIVVNRDNVVIRVNTI